jgi:Glutathione peroxidase
MAILPLFTMAQTKSFHDFTVKAMDGTDFNLSSLKGKKVLVVNTASKCGLTPQYEKLQLLFEKYGGDKFTIIAFRPTTLMVRNPAPTRRLWNSVL